MTKTDSHPKQPLLEEIVAYLDGELSEVESAQVEQRLSTDETYRCQMQGFDRVWSALDELPEVTAADSFSKTTMEFVVGVAEQAVQKQTEALPRLRRNRYVINSILVVAAAILGALGTQMVLRDPNEMLIADLPVIEHVDIYSQFQSIDFLRQLRTALGDDDWAAGEPTDSLESIDPQYQQSLFDPPLSAEDRRLWIDQLTPDHRLTLRTKYNRFHAFPPDHQRRLRQLYEALISANDTTQLQAVMSWYQQWLDGQPSSRQFELREMSKKSRVQAVTRRVRESQRKITLELTDEQMNKMRKTILRRMPEIRDHLHAEMSSGKRRNMASRDGHNRAWAQLRGIMMHRSDKAEVLHRAIAENLTIEQRDQFRKMSRQEKARHFSFWMRSGRFSSTSNVRGEYVSEQDLEELFAEELNAAIREELLALPREVMRKRLEQLYWGMEERPRSGGRTDRRPGSRDRPSRDHRPGPPHRQPPRNKFRPPDYLPHDRSPQSHQGRRQQEPIREDSVRNPLLRHE